MATTKFDELPLHYRHPTLEGTLILSFAVDDADQIIKGYYFWAVQDDVGHANNHQVIKGLTRLNEVRNEFIGEGWRRWLPPKVKMSEFNRKEKRGKEKIDEKNKKEITKDVKKRLQIEKQVEERRAALEKIKADVAAKTEK